MGRNRYVIQHEKKSFCKYCEQEVELLTPEYPTKRQKMFYVCWPCKKVFEAGVGEVPVEKGDE